jgi:hypothetical protein
VHREAQGTGAGPNDEVFPAGPVADQNAPAERMTGGRNVPDLSRSAATREADDALDNLGL